MKKSKYEQDKRLRKYVATGSQIIAGNKKIENLGKDKVKK
jgi:hypothetical protein